MIGVVLVTYNRINKLKTALRCFGNQICLPQYIVVVDNASTDGTGNFLDMWKKEDEGFDKYVIHKSSNTGGSGGFYAGLKYALNLNANWIWVSDDDAFPKEDAIKNSEAAIKKYSPIKDISAICGMVINNGEIDYSHRKSYKLENGRIKEIFSNDNDYKKDFFTIQAFSYVGTIINKEKLSKVGLPIKEYFIWCDDTEHSLRLSKVGEILCVPSIKVYHDVLYDIDDGITWKTYYGLRNKSDMYRRHFPKIYFYLFFFNTIRKTYINDLRKLKKEENKEIRCALKDAFFLNFGVHKKYKPGWKPK